MTLSPTMLPSRMPTKANSHLQIVQDISNIIQNDQNLESFDVIPGIEEWNLSPLKYEEHNIGIEDWYVKDLYPYVHRKIFGGTLDTKNQKIFLTTAVLLNSSVKTFWNMRRELVLQKELNILSELRIVNLVLSYSPKSQEAFCYRKWLLKDILAEKPLDFLVNELMTVQDVAEGSVNNNHTPWDYCAWLLEKCQFHKEFSPLIHSAFILSGQYMCSHPSDASNFNFRQRIITRVINNRDRLTEKFLPLGKKTAEGEGFQDLDDDDSYIIGIILYELHLNAALMDFFPNHEGIWCYRRFLVHLWFEMLPKLISESGQTVLRNSIFDRNDTSNDIFKVQFCRIQASFLSKVTDHISYIEKYRKWIETFV